MTAAAGGLLDGFHRHHVIPRHLGGSNNPDNLVLLHPYDHAIAHFVRWKMFGTGAQVAWNKGQKGLTKWDDDAKARHSEKIKQVWAKRKQEIVCRYPQP